MLKNGTKIILGITALVVMLYIGLFIGRSSVANDFVNRTLHERLFGYSENVVLFEHYDLNTASEEELQQIPGITPGIARSIVRYREKYGDFIDVRELRNLSEISDDAYDKIKQYVTVGG